MFGMGTGGASLLSPPKAFACKRERYENLLKIFVRLTVGQTSTTWFLSCEERFLFRKNLACTLKTKQCNNNIFYVVYLSLMLGISDNTILNFSLLQPLPDLRSAYTPIFASQNRLRLGASLLCVILLCKPHAWSSTILSCMVANFSAKNLALVKPSDY